MWRVWTVFVAFIAVYLVILVRLFSWQIIYGGELRLQALRQHFLTLSLPASRGAIETSDGKPIVMNQPAYLVYAVPPNISDKKQLTQTLSGILSIDEAQLLSQLSEPGRMWVPVAHRVDTQVVNALKSLSVQGIGFEREPSRYYPESSMAAHLLGFVGSDENGKDKGYFGIEGQYNRELSGRTGELSTEKDVRGAPILVGQSKRIEPQHGGTLRLWLDRSIQFLVERRLLEGIRRYGAKEGSVVVMDPQTGAIVAMASYPSYDPARYTQYEKELYKNPVVGNTYEPGSTFKVLVMSAAIEEGAVTPETIVDESGPVAMGEYFIRTWNNQYHGPITTTKVLEYSSNVGMVYVAQKLGRERMLRYLRAYGLGKPTGVDLEDEVSSELRPDSEWKDIDLATASFGQGIAVTPLQMVRAVAAIANGGYIVEPHAVSEVRDQRGRVITIAPKRVRRVISTQTASILTEMMVSAVDNGEAKWAKPKGYRIAGKTGTAQIPVAGHYDNAKTIASFVGFGPADMPRFVMLVTLREPTTSPWGSETAAPLFFTIARDIFSYYGIAPQ